MTFADLLFSLRKKALSIFLNERELSVHCDTTWKCCVPRVLLAASSTAHDKSTHWEQRTWAIRGGHALSWLENHFLPLAAKFAHWTAQRKVPPAFWESTAIIYNTSIYKDCWLMREANTWTLPSEKTTKHSGCDHLGPEGRIILQVGPWGSQERSPLSKIHSKARKEGVKLLPIEKYKTITEGISSQHVLPMRFDQGTMWHQSPEPNVSTAFDSLSCKENGNTVRLLAPGD